MVDVMTQAAMKFTFIDVHDDDHVNIATQKKRCKSIRNTLLPYTITASSILQHCTPMRRLDPRSIHTSPDRCHKL
jgi:hypothetical protein